jgi:hypothetical protein
MARKTKHFQAKPATHHPNLRLLLGISVIGILVFGAIAIRGTRSEALVSASANLQTPFVGSLAKAPH